jgi:hypothetical protein
MQLTVEMTAEDVAQAMEDHVLKTLGVAAQAIVEGVYPNFSIKVSAESTPVKKTRKARTTAPVLDEATVDVEPIPLTPPADLFAVTADSFFSE